MKAEDRSTFRVADERRLVELTEQITTRLRSDPLFDVDAFVAQYPEQAGELRRLLPALEALVRLGDKQRSVEDSLGPVLSGLKDQMLGDFRLVAEVGRGGMGVVYEARQTSLGRRVALKILPFAAMLDQQQLIRFRNEARAAATLNHPGIVSVYSVGSEAGVHYYAMEFIDGRSLAEILERWRSDRRAIASTDRPANEDRTRSAHSGPGHRPAPGCLAWFESLHESDQGGEPRERVRAVAELGKQAAVALHHAHERGVVHRDVKPGNLLLDGAGVLRVADFGLARTEADAGLTLTGDCLGTLRYMPPEQALGKRPLVNHRADIYALGATLYELLTLRPAFDGQDREQILRQIVFEEPPPPRHFDVQAPVDLETIILKSMAKEEADRYESAAEMADDLGRFLRDEPITARRPTFSQRAAKWAYRRRRLVTAAAAGLMLLIAGVALAVALVVQQSRVAQREARHAEQNFARAREAVDRMLTKAADQLAGTPHTQNVRRALLDDALEFYQGFLDERAADPAVRYETALAWNRVAAIRAAMGERAAAATAARQAVELLHDLKASYPDEPQYLLALAATHGTLAQATLVPARAEDLGHRRTRYEILRELADVHPEVDHYRLLAAEAQANLGQGLLQAGHFEQAIKPCQQAVTALEHLSGPGNASPDHIAALAAASHWLGAALIRTGRYVDGEFRLRQSLAQRTELLVSTPASPKDRLEAAVVQAWIGHAAKAQHKHAVAIDQYRQAIQQICALSEDFPLRAEYLSRSATLYNDLAQTLAAAGQRDEAAAALRESLDRHERLLQIDPGVAGYLSYVAWQQFKLGAWHARRSEADAASAAFAKALHRWEEYRETHPADLRSTYGLCWFLSVCPLEKFQDGRRAVELAYDLIAAAPENADYWLALAAAHYCAGQPKDALAALRRATHDKGPEKAYGAFLKALSHAALGADEKALGAYGRAVASVGETSSETFSSPREAEHRFFQDPELGYLWERAESQIGGDP